MPRPRLASRLLFAVHVAFGGALVAALAFAPPLVLGSGRFEELAGGIETFDFKWWFTGLALAVWLLPIVLVVLWRRASDAGLELARIRSVVEQALKDRVIPVTVDVEGRIPVKLEGPLHVPVELRTNIAFDETIDVEAEVPVRAEIPVDTEIETTLLRFGTIRIPIRARIPIDVVLPVKSRVHVRAKVPIDLREEATVSVPPLEVPVSSRLETRIDLLENLRAAKGLLKRG